MEKTTVAVLGATGTVGQRYVEILSEHPWFQLTSMTGDSSAGHAYGDAVRWFGDKPLPEDFSTMRVTESDPELIDADLVFSAIPSKVAKGLEPKLAEAGFPVLSNASTHRMTTDVPLVIPEVNPDHLSILPRQKRNRRWEGCIVTDPNCSTINLALALAPVHRLARVEKAFVTTLQSVSGAGYPGVPSIDSIDNVIPHIDGEEEKLATETKKILGNIRGGSVQASPMDIEASCNRVPTTDGHLEVVNLKTENPVTEGEVRGALETFEGPPQELGLPTAPEDPIVITDEEARPQTRLDRMAGTVPGMSITVGRLRVSADARWIRMVVLGHNTIRGAAGTSVLTAELLVEKEILGRN